MGLPDDDTGGVAGAPSAPGATGRGRGTGGCGARAAGAAGAGAGAGRAAGGTSTGAGAGRGGIWAPRARTPGRSAGGAGAGGGASGAAGSGAGAGASAAGGSSTAAGAGSSGASAAGAGASGAAAAGTSGSGVASVAGSGASALGAAFLAGAFLAGDGSSGCSSRTKPSRSALRRTRSAWASSMLDECVLTPMPRSSARSRVSLFVRPSSFASSWTRIFAANVGSPALLCCGCVRRRALAGTGFLVSRRRGAGHEVSSAGTGLRLDQLAQGLDLSGGDPGAERPVETAPTGGQIQARGRVLTEPGASPRQCTAGYERSVGSSGHPAQLVGGPGGPTADAGSPGTRLSRRRLRRRQSR